MPLFNTSISNINPDINPNEIPIDELPKCEVKRKLSIKKSFFTWSSQKQFIDQNKFLFDSNCVLPSSKKGKKNHHDSIILKSNKYTISGSSVNYDESDNDCSSESDIDEEVNGKDYYSMEDLDNITALKKKFPKVRNVAQLSESTLCYSSNTNTIKSVSMEFSTKSKPNNNTEESPTGEEVINEFEENQNNNEVNNESVNYGFEENQNNNEKKEEVINYGFEENQNNNEKKEEVINYGFEKNQNNNEKKEEVINHGFEKNQDNNEKKEEVINYGFEKNQNNNENKDEVINSEENQNNNEKKNNYNEDYDIEMSNEDNFLKKENSDFNDTYSYEDTDEESEDDVFEFDDVNSSYSNPNPYRFDDFNSSYSNSHPQKKLSSARKTVTFCENIEIIEPRKYKRTKNIFRRAISKIIKKKEEEDHDII